MQKKCKTKTIRRKEITFVWHLLRNTVTLHTLSDITVLVFLYHDNYVRIALSKNLANDYIFILLYEKIKKTLEILTIFSGTEFYINKEKNICLFSPHCKAVISQQHDRSVALLILI